MRKKAKLIHCLSCEHEHCQGKAHTHAVQWATSCSHSNKTEKKNLKHVSIVQLSLCVLLTERPFFLQDRLQQQCCV